MFNLKMTKEEALKIQAEQVEWYGATRPWLAAAVAIRTTADKLESGKEYSLETINRHIPRGGEIEFLIERHAKQEQETQNKLKLAAYVADYINEEIIRGNTQVDRWMVLDALKAYEGGATEVAA